MSALLICIYACLGTELLGQELETVVYLHGGAGNQIYVPCRSAKCSLVSHLSSAKCGVLKYAFQCSKYLV